MYSVSIQGKNIQILVTDFMVYGGWEKKDYLLKREAILMDSESRQFGCVSGVGG